MERRNVITILKELGKPDAADTSPRWCTKEGTNGGLKSTSVRPLGMKYHCFYHITCCGSCRNGAKGAGAGALELADCKPARGLPTSMRGQDASRWPGSPHLSAKGSFYLCGLVLQQSKSKAWVGKEKDKRVIAAQAWYIWGI